MKMIVGRDSLQDSSIVIFMKEIKIQVAMPVSSSRNTKYIKVKAGLQSETCMQANRLDGYLSTLFLTLLICLQCSDINSGRGDVSKDAQYKPEKTREIFMLVFFKIVVKSQLKPYCRKEMHSFLE